MAICPGTTGGDVIVDLTLLMAKASHNLLDDVVVNLTHPIEMGPMF